MQECKDGSGLQFINFELFSYYFVSSVNISLLSSLLGIFTSYFEITKQAPGYNHENTIHQPRQRPVIWRDTVLLRLLTFGISSICCGLYLGGRITVPGSEWSPGSMVLTSNFVLSRFM